MTGSTARWLISGALAAAACVATAGAQTNTGQISGTVRARRVRSS